MKTLSDLFGDLTAAIEDVHGIAVDGQQADLSADMHEAILSAARLALVRVHRIMADIALTLP